ncbi:MAG: ABATE domain-containing protein [Oceanicaulis sp.]
MGAAWSDIGGAPILNFLNTAGVAGKARDAEQLTSHAALLDWGVWAGVLSAGEAEHRRGGFSRPHLIDRREALHALLSAHAGGGPAPEPALARVTGWIAEARSRAVLEAGAGGYAWRAGLGLSAGDVLSDRLALEAERLVTGPDLANVRECVRCSWMFLSKGRGRPRRWCAMSACGNREKAKRHYARRKAPTPRTPD